MNAIIKIYIYNVHTHETIQSNQEWALFDHFQLKKVWPQPPHILYGSTVHFFSTDVLLNSAAKPKYYSSSSLKRFPTQVF